MRISHENFCNLLLNAFRPHWLKEYQGYPLGIANLESVRLNRGKNGIHLDDKEHVILEHCVDLKRNKLLAKELGVVIFIDSDHLECAEAHLEARRKMLETCSPSNDLSDSKADPGVAGVRFSSCFS